MPRQTTTAFRNGAHSCEMPKGTQSLDKSIRVPGPNHPGNRTYRGRRDRYTRSLEDEVGRVPAREANLLREVKRLRRTVQTFARMFGHHGFDALTDSELDSPGLTGLHGKPSNF